MRTRGGSGRGASRVMAPVYGRNTPACLRAYSFPRSARMQRPSSDRILQAMKLLTDEARERIDLHPLGHLLAGRGEPLDLHLAVPTALREGRLEQMSREAEEAIRT